jgi:outer membrane protein OmpA-like peptidoglycan-associated protein
MFKFISKQKMALLVMLFISAGSIANAQQAQPIWWFGASGAANFNFYQGTTQVINESVTTPTAFHKGKGISPYVSILTEYRPNKTWGGMLNLAYDNRSGKFDEVMAPCDCPATLSTKMSYFSIEPALRVAPFGSSFYVFAGPTIGINVKNEFTYKQQLQTDKTGEWSDIRKTVISAQAGLGIDIPVSAKTSAMQTTLSPFASFQSNLGHDPRSTGSWSMYTVRAGVALKFGKTRNAKAATVVAEPYVAPVVAGEKDVVFSIRAPKYVPASRQVKETFPFRNSVFFDMGSAVIPNRYVQLNSAQAVSFKESGLQENQPGNLNNGRSARQMAVYHNILNIIGDRLRSNLSSTIKLSGASDNNPTEGKLMAENVKQYLVSVFGIAPSRIITEGRDKPVIASEQPGATHDLTLLREGDRRVDIESNSSELLMQVGGVNSPFMKPVQIIAVDADPLDSHVLFNADGATETLKSWNVMVTDDKGKMQHYGPYTTDHASVPGKTILGSNTEGNYKILMQGITNNGKTIKQESNLSLVKAPAAAQEGLRYSILFDFDKSKSIATYENFLTNVVTPLIPANGKVIIHGHTDIIGDEIYNRNLSNERATGAQRIIEAALAKRGTKGVVFETNGFGEDEGTSPFENKFPEERFYNRTVIIDIIPVK